MLQRTLPAGFIAPCLPGAPPVDPSGGILFWDDLKIDHFVMAITSAEVIVP
jgi:hypothetical protein